MEGKMANEVAFVVRGKETKQALFLQEDDWDRSLINIRTILEEQDLCLPLTFRFLTLSGNAIPEPREENILLKDIAHNLDLKSQSVDKFWAEDDSSLPEVHVCPLKVTFPKFSSPDAGGTESNESAGSTNQQNPEACTCPFKMFTDSIKKDASPKMMLKFVFGLVLILFAILASLTLTMHVLVRTFTSMHPAMKDILSQFKSDDVSSGAVAGLQAKLSQLEASYRYETDFLNTRLAELEDLYLKDLAVHKKELNLLKKKQATGDTGAPVLEEEGKYVGKFEIPEETKTKKDEEVVDPSIEEQRDEKPKEQAGGARAGG